MKARKIIFSLTYVFVLSLFFIKGVIAEDVTVIGSIQHSIIQEGISSSRQHEVNSHEKVIQLLHIQLSEEAKVRLEKQAKNALAHTHQFSRLSQQTEALEKIHLGMNNVPVLDQGAHGTCVTFAITGALDAAIGKGDYISQLCNLQLGNYLEKHWYGPSGWDGSSLIYVINQIEQYGIINQEKQKTLGCGGLTQYPTKSKDTPESFIDPEHYYPMSELVFGVGVNWSNIYWRISSNWTLDAVKKALLIGDRAVFATIIPHTDLGFVGAVGHYKTQKDTWVLTPEILNSIHELEAGHAMIIIGYDDNAVAVDNNGQEHRGLLTLRNSWGSNAGDHGEFYMSYDYFKLLVFEVKRFSANQRIITIAQLEEN